MSRKDNEIPRRGAEHSNKKPASKFMQAGLVIASLIGLAIVIGFAGIISIEFLTNIHKP